MSTVTGLLAHAARKHAFLPGMLVAALLIMAVPGASLAAGKAETPPAHHPKDYIVTVDSKSAKVIGPVMVQQITDFFDYADNAIKTKDLNKLGTLYSEKYIDGNHTKADVLQAWKKLFAEFDDFSMTHNLTFVTTDPNSNVMIVECSGILMAKPRTDQMLRALDHWMNLKHVLVKEEKRWRIIGTGGPEEKRFWFDKPMHPLF